MLRSLNPVSETHSSPSSVVSAQPLGAGGGGGPPLQLVRLPVEKPQLAVAFLHARSRGVMDLIAHFWERLSQTPPLQRADLHLVVAAQNTLDNQNINITNIESTALSGAMLYVPKAHRADVLATDSATAAAFAAYIRHQGPKMLPPESSAALPSNDSATSPGESAPSADAATSQATLSFTDISTRNGTPADPTPMPAEFFPPSKTPSNGRTPIDFLTGDAPGIFWMTPLLLPLVNRRVPARQLVNIVMQLPPDVPTAADPNVRLAQDIDVPTLNRWRRLYKEERGILFDADMDALVERQRVFVYELDKQVVALAKIDMDLQNLVEIGGVYTFPEFRKRGYGAGIVRDLASRIRQGGKTPTLQVDDQNTPALHLYEAAGWRTMGKLARVWLTG